MMPRPVAVLGVSLLLATAGGMVAPFAAAAQERDGILVTGRVVDGLTGTPLPAVQVRFRAPPPDPDLPPDEEAGPPEEPLRPRDAVTDGDGRFQLPEVATGLYLLRVESLGYQVVEQRIRVMGASPFDIQVQLAPEALALEGVVVTSMRSPRLAAGGFYDRLAMGHGTFVTREQIDARTPLRTSDIFRAMAGVQVRSSPRSGVGLITLRGGCRPDIVIDGLNLGSDLSVDEVLIPSDLEAVELYRVAGAPPQYSRNTCGVILLWSADPSMRRGDRPFSWRRLAVAGIFVAVALVLTR
jgi:hypothetical protein